MANMASYPVSHPISRFFNFTPSYNLKVTPLTHAPTLQLHVAHHSFCL